jgi:hypothetical protein
MTTVNSVASMLVAAPLMEDNAPISRLVVIEKADKKGGMISLGDKGSGI